MRLQIILSSMVLVLLSSCSPAEEESSRPPQVYLPPRILPDDALKNWDRIVRITEAPSFETAVEYTSYINATVLRIEVCRFWGDEIELQYSWDLTIEDEEDDADDKSEASTRHGDWIRDMPESDDASGFDGTTVTAQLVSENFNRTIHRWSPSLDTEERELTAMVHHLDFVRKCIGVHPRSNVGQPSPE